MDNENVIKCKCMYIFIYVFFSRGFSIINRLTYYWKHILKILDIRLYQGMIHAILWMNA